MKQLAFELPLPPNLTAEYGVDEMARPFDLRYRQRATDVFAIAAGCDNACGFQDGEVLREVCLGNVQGFLQLENSPLAPAQNIQQLETLGMSEGPADHRLPFKDLGLDR